MAWARLSCHPETLLPFTDSTGRQEQQLTNRVQECVGKLANGSRGMDIRAEALHLAELGNPYIGFGGQELIPGAVTFSPFCAGKRFQC